MQPAVRLSAAVQSAGVTLASINDSNWQQCTSPTFHFLSRRQRSRVVQAKQKHATKIDNFACTSWHRTGAFLQTNIPGPTLEAPRCE